MTYDVRDNLVRHFFTILPRKKPNQLLFKFFPILPNLAVHHHIQKEKGERKEDISTYTVPVFAIFEFTCLFVPLLSVQKKDNKVDEVKVCERGVEAGGETPSETVLFLRQRILYEER